MAAPEPQASAVQDARQTDVYTEDKPGRNVQDVEAGRNGPATEDTKHTSAFKQLGLLDRFLAVWIFLAMAVGIILGNFVPSTGPALQKGKFVGVSVPIGKSPFLLLRDECVGLT